jgi:hypothetical protein
MAKERMKIELEAAPRIAVQEGAEKPLAPSNVISRPVLAAVAMLVTCCCVAAVVIFSYARTRRRRTANG